MPYPHARTGRGNHPGYECDGIIASEKATFSTPFTALGVTPEGCSSVQFARLMGQANADRMLGVEGWKPTAEEALEAGLIQWLAPHDKLAEESYRIAREWIASGAARNFRGGSGRDELKAVPLKHPGPGRTAVVCPGDPSVATDREIHLHQKTYRCSQHKFRSRCAAVARQLCGTFPHHSVGNDT